MRQFGSILARFVLSHRWMTIFFMLVVAGLSTAGIQNLGFTADYKIYFDENNPHLLAFEALQETYTKNDSVLMALAPEDGAVFTQKTLGAVADITERAWQTPHSVRVDSLSNFQHTKAEEDDLLVANLYEIDSSLTPDALERIKNIALAEPFLRNRMVNAEASITGINITISLPEVDTGAAEAEVVAHVRQLKAYVESTYPQLKVYLTGTTMLNNAFLEATVHDFSRLIPLAILVILLLVWLQLRTVGGTLITFVVIILSISSAMGLAGWIGIQLSTPAMSAPTIILTLATADCVHLLTNWLARVRSGTDKPAAMVESMKSNFGPIALTTITTAAGFLSLNFSDTPPFRDLGNISAIGVMFALLFGVTLLPVLAVMTPVSKRKVYNMAGVFQRFSAWVVRVRSRLMPIMLILIVGLIACIPKNHIDDVFVRYFDERIEFRRHTEFVTKNLTGIYFIDYSMQSGESGGIANPHYLAQLGQFTDWLRQQPEVIHVNSLTDVFKRVNKSMHADKSEWYRLPENRNLAAQYLLIYEMSLPYGLDLNNQIDIDKQSSRISVTTQTLSTMQTLAFEKRVDRWMGNNIPELATTGASPVVMFSHIGLKNIISMLGGTSLALVAISFLLMWAFRSWRYGLITLIPNIAPAAMAFGLWGLIDGEVGLSLSIVAAMTLGIVVDDTIHFMNKFLLARRGQGKSAIVSVHYAFSQVGMALVVTTLALTAGFLVLATSAFSLNAEMGLLVAIVILLALAVDFLLLPCLLIAFDPWLVKDPAQRGTAQESELLAKT